MDFFATTRPSTQTENSPRPPLTMATASPVVSVMRAATRAALGS